jgi:ribosomal protein S4
MRKISKYKIYFKTKKIIPLCSNRILNFKRPKWKFLKLFIFKNDYQRKVFTNCSVLENKESSWLRSEKFFLNNLASKRLFYQLYDSSICIPSKKDFFKNSTVLTFLKAYLIKYEYRLDVLLYKLGYYLTLHEAKSFISQNHVLVNGLHVQHNLILKKNDIVCLQNYKNKFDALTRNITISFYLPFVEADFYTNTIVVTKNLNELSVEDLSVMFPFSEGLDKFYNLNLR